MRIPGIILALVFLATSIQAQENAVLVVESAQDVYEKGEDIQILITLTNDGSEPFDIWGSTSCRGEFVLDEFNSLDHHPCTADDFPITYAPGATRLWVWHFDPLVFGMSETTGAIHQLVGYHASLPSFTDTTQFVAPAFIGGQLTANYALSTDPAPIQSVKDSLNAVVLQSDTSHTTNEVFEQWRIEGVTVAQAEDWFGEDPRFDVFCGCQQIPFPSVEWLPTTSAETLPTSVHVAVFPNPFRSATEIRFSPPRTERLRIEVFDVLGRHIRSLFDGTLAGGTAHTLNWRAASLPSGLYVIRIVGTSFVQTLRVTLQR